MSEKEAGLYRGNGTKDEETLRSKRLTTKQMPYTLTTLMTLGQLVRLGMFLIRQIVPSLQGSVHSEIMDPQSEGETEEGKIMDDGSI